ncbi:MULTISPECIES: substrate-binding domain-containing protein [unclassified Pseudofrankia]|uniref:substrate-binding domain-containing protein n=1 Tax=unclassified Pseudofrankia TaxID=2994372 RepID=UPI0008DADAAF|nr:MULTISPECIES: substrate-binding domain-containing protein [unclassified Pseudofrankia]MDT3446330.1 substrate-binding domain-containing protein [Pseudofrankia sp. BMG5.37]OHV56737.1 hypothetical protein BCD48_43590 [Pseudofrankia sp. BMG5.36]
MIACAMAGEGCAAPSKAVAEAGGRIGWEVKIFDGQGDPTVQNNGIRSAIANDADAIVLVAVDCQAVRGALEQAKQAQIPIYGTFSMDCNEAGQTGPKLFDAWAASDPERSQYSEYIANVRYPVTVDWIVDQVGPEAHVLISDYSDTLFGKTLTAAMQNALAEGCPQCTATKFSFNTADSLNGNLRGKTAAALTKDPSIDVVTVVTDFQVSVGIGPGVTQAGRPVLIAGYEGLSANIKEISSGGPQSLATGFPTRWVGWQTIDELNRIFNNSPLVDEGMGLQAIDATHNLPAVTTFYDGNVDAKGLPRQDYEANFLRIWGVN